MLIKKFWNLPRREKGLFIEAVFRLFIAHVLIILFPFRKIAPGLGKHMNESSPETRSCDIRILPLIRHAIGRAARFIPKKRACLVRSIAGQMMLKRRNIPYTLYLGLIKNTGKDDEKETELNAHAWLRSGDVILTGSEGVKLSEFTVISTFGEEGK